MRIQTAIVASAVAVALAVPVAAGAAPPQHQYRPTAVVTTVYLGTSAVPGACTMTLTNGHASSFRCPGSTATHAGAGRCTLTVAAGPLWTYSCPAGKAGSAAQGAVRGAIPVGCKPLAVSGFRWVFGCLRSALRLQ
ncbi:MAG TPA: hypothetical protein VH538_00775 [Gaiellaceae bacterium]